MAKELKNSGSTGMLVGISGCLLGEPVRYDGQHKRDHELVETLAEHLQLLPFCPEVAIGLGVPRPPIQLREVGGRIHAIGVEDAGRDVTCNLQDVGKAFGRRNPALCGYVFKSRSPSCGLSSSPVVLASGTVVDGGRGIFAEALITVQPLLPVAEDQELQCPQAIQDFINKVVHYYDTLVQKRTET
ncbi:MAG: DUF523 domain-containing protein [Proteobacteria bacterium]|nr:DUF523 domain-containing protein [Pseudomonadota bacterium]